MQHLELIRAIQQSILEGSKPAKSISQEIGKPYSTMLREVNPFDTSAKIGVETLMDIMRSTGNVAPLRIMARELGYSLSPQSNEPQDTNTEYKDQNFYSTHQ
ncbi:MAG: phage regulatory CII family protein [Desulfovibrio sp.]